MLPLCRLLDVGRPEQVAALSRDAVEQDLAFLGLIVFRNELKPDSRDAILALKKGYVRPVMVTGDNAQASSFRCMCIMYCPGAKLLQHCVHNVGEALLLRIIMQRSASDADFNS